MFNNATGPENDPLSPDEFDRLEEMHKRMIESQEAWRKLLENLDRVKSKRSQRSQPSPAQTEIPRTEKPSE